MTNLENDIRFLEGYVISELAAPRSFVGRSLRQIKVRNKYGVDVLSIKENRSRQPRYRSDSPRRLQNPCQ